MNIKTIVQISLIVGILIVLYAGFNIGVREKLWMESDSFSLISMGIIVICGAVLLSGKKRIHV